MAPERCGTQGSPGLPGLPFSLAWRSRGDFPGGGSIDALVGRRMSTLLAELRRRNVLKVAAGYIVAA
jgi:hypothetical protein